MLAINDKSDSLSVQWRINSSRLDGIASRLSRSEREINAVAFSKTYLAMIFSFEPFPGRVSRKGAAVLIGYARVSTQEQNLDLQKKALSKAGCKKVFEDKVSGTRAARPGLDVALATLREGDTLKVWKLDRLGRSVKNLIDLVGELRRQGVQFHSLTDLINTGTPSGRFFFHVMTSLAQSAS